MISIVNYGSGNIRAIGNIYDRLGIAYIVADKPEQLLNAEKIILPGVGAFDETIKILDKTGFREVLDEAILQKAIPTLGICVGMQILSEGSEEGKLPGLGWIKGRVKKIDKADLVAKPKLPHLGWNVVSVEKANKLFLHVNEADGFYFLHSYYFDCADTSNVLGETFYGRNFASAVWRDNIYGVQFHPEKSHHNGTHILKNFALL